MKIPSHLLPRDGRFGAGPSRIPAQHMEFDPGWMGTSHRADPVTSIVADIRHAIGALFDLPDGYEVIAGNGGASLVWDALPFCVVEETAQAASMGAFSEKTAQALTGSPYSFDPIVVRAEPGSAVECSPCDATTYLYPHNETSTGVSLPVTRVDVDDALTVVDGTSAAGGVDLDISQTDIYYFSPQKCFASDGGLFLAVLSPAAIARISRLTSSRWVPDILNLKLALDASRKNQTLNTPALATLHMLNQQLAWMLDEGGLATMDARTARSSALVYDWTRKTEWAHGFAEERYRSQVTVTIDIDLDQSDIVTVARENGIVDIGGYRGLGRNQLRIATFPATEPAEIEALLACLTWIGEHLDAPR